jgi:hypothetical protein
MDHKHSKNLVRILETTPITISTNISAMDIELTSNSPISFAIVKEGDVALIKIVEAKPNEYMEKIGPPKDCFLIFKGPTKIGMIPLKVATEELQLIASRKCLISIMNKAANKICISMSRPIELQAKVS